jgi:hypothetical protein
MGRLSGNFFLAWLLDCRDGRDSLSQKTTIGLQEVVVSEQPASHPASSSLLHGSRLISSHFRSKTGNSTLNGHKSASNPAAKSLEPSQKPNSSQLSLILGYLTVPSMALLPSVVSIY